MVFASNSLKWGMYWISNKSAEFASQRYFGDLSQYKLGYMYSGTDLYSISVPQGSYAHSVLQTASCTTLQVFSNRAKHF